MDRENRLVVAKGRRLVEGWSRRLRLADVSYYRTFPETNRGVETSTVPTAKLTADHGHSDVFHGAAADTAPGPVVENFQAPSTLLVLADHPEGQEL